MFFAHKPSLTFLSPSKPSSQGNYLKKLVKILPAFSMLSHIYVFRQLCNFGYDFANLGRVQSRKCWLVTRSSRYNDFAEFVAR